MAAVLCLLCESVSKVHSLRLLIRQQCLNRILMVVNVSGHSIWQTKHDHSACSFISSFIGSFDISFQSFVYCKKYFFKVLNKTEYQITVVYTVISYECHI